MTTLKRTLGQIRQLIALLPDISEKEARIDMKEPIDFITSSGCGKTGVSWHLKCAPMINKMFESITFSKPTAMNPKLLKHLKSR